MNCGVVIAFNSTRWVCSHSSHDVAVGSVVRIASRLHIVGDRLAPLALLHVLDLKPHLDRLPRLQAEIDDLDLAGAARLGRFLQRLIDHRAVGIGVVTRRTP